MDNRPVERSKLIRVISVIPLLKNYPKGADIIKELK